MRVGLIGCGKEKLSHAAPAAELYTGPFFSLCKKWISKPGRVDEWGILSAKHGLVLPSQVIEPYDLTLDRMGQKAQKKWAESTHEQLLEQWGSDHIIYMILAGSYYRTALYKMPMVEDAISHWTEMRRLRGMGKPHMGIGVIKKYILEDRSFGA